MTTKDTGSPAFARGFSFVIPPSAKVYIRPLVIPFGPEDHTDSQSFVICSGWSRYRDVEIIWRPVAEDGRADTGRADIRHASVGRVVVGRADLESQMGQQAEPVRSQISIQLNRLDAAHSPIITQSRNDDPLRTLSLASPNIMGVLNVTPDSFSDGGKNDEPDRAVAAACQLAEAGAAIIDIGGQSTRPGAEPVGAEEELGRVLPVLDGLTSSSCTRPLISIDTYLSDVMARTAAAGVDIINDVTALTGDPNSLQTAAGSGLPVILMHMQGEPRTMQSNPHYAHVVLDVFDALERRVQACESAGIARNRIILDPGIGFGKTVTHNLQLLQYLSLFHCLGCPLLLGVSRKSFIAKLSRDEDASQRLPGTLAATLAGVAQGVQLHRMHDVAETVQANAIFQAIVRGRSV